MNSGSTYPRNTALAVLLAGNPGAGKTNLCFEFPKPWFLDADQNLRNAVERHPGTLFHYDCPEFAIDGAALSPEQHWPRMEALIKDAGPKPEVGTIVIDGIGRVTDYLKAFLVKQINQAEKPLIVGGMPAMTMALWSPYADLLKKLVFLCRSYGKPVIITTHLTVDENELTTVKEQRPLIQGSLKADFPKLFTDFWQCDALPNSDARYKAANNVRYFVRTVPTHRIMLKQSAGLPAEFEHDAPEFRKLLASLSNPLPPVGQPVPPELAAVIEANTAAKAAGKPVTTLVGGPK